MTEVTNSQKTVGWWNSEPNKPVKPGAITAQPAHIAFEIFRAECLDSRNPCLLLASTRLHHSVTFNHGAPPAAAFCVWSDWNTKQGFRINKTPGRCGWVRRTGERLAQSGGCWLDRNENAHPPTGGTRLFTSARKVQKLALQPHSEQEHVKKKESVNLTNYAGMWNPTVCFFAAIGDQNK